MLVDLRPEGPDRQGGGGALGRARITCNKNGIPFDTQKPTVTSGHSARLAGGDVARVRRRRIQKSGRIDRRDARWAGGAGRSGQCCDRSAGARRRRRPDAAISHLLTRVSVAAHRAVMAGLTRPCRRSLWWQAIECNACDGSTWMAGSSPAMTIIQRGQSMRCPYCGALDTQVEGFAADRRRVFDPPPAHLLGLRRPLHHLRARAVARPDRDQEERPSRAVRPRQALSLGRSRAAQARRLRRTRRADDQRHRAAIGEPGRRRHSDPTHRRDW